MLKFVPMVPVRVPLLILLTLALLTACKPMDIGPLVKQIEAQVTVRTMAAGETVTPQFSATAAEVSQTATISPTETLTPGDSSLTVTPTGFVDVLTPSVTGTQVITATQKMVPEVITSAQMVTSTWTFQDVRVTETGTINKAAWVGEDQIAVAASTGLYLYQAADLALVRATNLGEAVLSLAYIQREHVLAWGDFKGDIHWIDPQNGQYLATTSGHRLGVTSLVQAPGSAYLVSGSDDGSVRTWVPSFVIYQISTGQAWMDLWQAPDRVTSVAANSYRPLVVAGTYRRVTVWNLDTGDRVWASWDLRGWIDDVALSPDGRTLGVADSSNQFMMWSTSDWRLTHLLPIQGCDQITALDFGPDDFQVALGCKNGALFLFGGEENTLSPIGEVYPSAVTDVVFHPYEASVLVGYQDGTLRVWSLEALGSGQ
jgi:WD40 repeat protein